MLKYILGVVVNLSPEIRNFNKEPDIFVTVHLLHSCRRVSCSSKLWKCSNCQSHNVRNEWDFYFWSQRRPKKLLPLHNDHHLLSYHFHCNHTCHSPPFVLFLIIIMFIIIILQPSSLAAGVLTLTTLLHKPLRLSAL